MLLFPTPFQAMHLYSPDWSRLIAVKLSVSLYDETLSGISRIHAVLGSGLPVAVQRSVTLSSSLTKVGHCSIVTFGGTRRKQWSVNSILQTTAKFKQVDTVVSWRVWYFKPTNDEWNDLLEYWVNWVGSWSSSLKYQTKLHHQSHLTSKRI